MGLPAALSRSHKERSILISRMTIPQQVAPSQKSPRGLARAILLLLAPIREQVRALLGDLHKLLVVAVQPLHANLPRPFRRRRSAEKDHRAVRRVAGVVLDIGAEGQLLPVLAVHADLVDVALDGLAEELRAVFRPAR